MTYAFRRLTLAAVAALTVTAASAQGYGGPIWAHPPGTFVPMSTDATAKRLTVLCDSSDEIGVYLQEKMYAASAAKQGIKWAEHPLYKSLQQWKNHCVLIRAGTKGTIQPTDRHFSGFIVTDEKYGPGFVYAADWSFSLDADEWR